MSDGGDNSGVLTTDEIKKRKTQQKQAVGLPMDNLVKMYAFLETMSGGLDPQQTKNIHQNPLALIRTDKDNEL